MSNIYKIIGNPEGFQHLDVFHKLTQQFMPYAQEKLQFEKPVDVQLMSDPQNAKDPLGKTAYYDPKNMKITLFVDNRHVKDILRSLAHELVHHKQNCRGDFDGNINTGPGYAQEDGKMRKLEGEAYLEGSGYLFRDWEDTLKKENKGMSINEVFGARVAKHKSEKDKKDTKKEKKQMSKKDKKEKTEELDENQWERFQQRQQKEKEAQKKKKEAEETVDEGKGESCEACGDDMCEGDCGGEIKETNETWFRGDKNQVLFETLVKKWAK